MKSKLKLLIIGLSLVVSASVNAHTISLGFLNSGPGSVTFWGGSYHNISEGPNSEGSIDLTGVLGTMFGPVNQAFSGGVTAVKPAGLMDGVNNFYANNNSNPNGLLVNTNTTGLPVTIWQSVTFTGLVAGDYQFDFNGLNTTQRFAPWDQSLSSIFQLTGTVVNPDPDPTGIPSPAGLALLAIGLLGMRFSQRKKA